MKLEPSSVVVLTVEVVKVVEPAMSLLKMKTCMVVKTSVVCFVVVVEVVKNSKSYMNSTNRCLPTGFETPIALKSDRSRSIANQMNHLLDEVNLLRSCG